MSTLGSVEVAEGPTRREVLERSHPQVPPKCQTGQEKKKRKCFF